MGFLAKEPGIREIAQADGCQRGAFLAKLVFVFAQLRDVLSAEDSTIVPEENHHGRAGTPERTKFYRMFIHVRQGDFGESAAIRFSHGLSFSWALPCMSRMNHGSFSRAVC